MKNIIQLCTLLALSLVLAGCFRQKSDHSAITIGAVYNLTGSQSELDGPSRQGARTAVEEINRNGGLLGRHVVLAVEDGQSEPQVVARKTEKLFTDNQAIPAIIGLSDTDMVLAAAPVAAGHQRIFLTSGATSPRLPQQVGDYLFLACFGDNVQAAVGAEWAYANLAARRVMILYEQNSTYTRLLKGYFQTRFEELGGHVVETTAYATDALNSLSLDSGQFDLIYLAATPESVLPAIAHLRKAGLLVPVLGGDGLDIGKAWQNGRQLQDVFFTTHAYLGDDTTNPRVKTFRKLFAEVYPDVEPDAFTALGFDSVRLLAEAIRRAGTTAPDGVRHALANIKGFAGVTGDISYLSDSQIPLKSVSIIKVTNGGQQLVGEFLPAKIPKP